METRMFDTAHPPHGPRLRPVSAAIASALTFAMLAAAPARVQAPIPASQDNTKLDTVIVTANKRTQNLQDVPAAISVLTDATMDRANVRDLEDLPSLSPALT